MQDAGRRNDKHKSRATARARNAWQHSKGWAQAKKHDKNKKHGGRENKKHDGHGTSPTKIKKSTKDKIIKIITL